MNNAYSHTAQTEFRNLDARLEAVRSKFYAEEMISGAIAWGASVICLVAAAILGEYAFGWSSSVRTGIVTALAIIAAGLLGALVIRPLVRRFRVFHTRGLSADETAMLVGRHFPDVGDHLRNLMQLGRSGTSTTLYSDELLGASLREFSERSRSMDFTSVVTSERIKRTSLVGIAVAAGFLLLILFPGSEISGAAYRLAHFQTEFMPPLPFRFSVAPGNVRVIKNESVSITIRALPNTYTALAATLPTEITLVLVREGVSAPEQLVLKSDAQGVFRYVSNSLKQSFTYAAESGEVKSETYSVQVTDRPFIRSFAMRIAPPRYARLPEMRLDDNTGDGASLAGSLVQWDVHPSKEIAHAAVVFDGGKRLPLVSHNGVLHASMTLSSTVGYAFELADDQAVTNENPIRYMLTAVSDAMPEIAIVAPGKNLDIVERVNIPLQIRIADDYGFSALRLQYRLVHSKYEKPQDSFSTITIPLPSQSDKEQLVAYLWDVSPLSLVPEDVIEYHAEVTDNDAVTGPKTVKSDSYLLRLPSMEEVFADAEKEQTGAVKTLDESLKQAEALKKELDELDLDVKKNQASDWQKQKKADELIKQYSDIQKKAESMSKQMEAMTQELQKNNLLSPETLKKYAELQKLMQQLNSPEFLEALKKMQEAMKAANPEQLRQAMQNVKFSEESFRNSIERTMNLLKRIQVEQKTDELVKRAQELEKNQEDIRNKTSELQPSDRENAQTLARKQDDLSNDLADIQKEIEKLKAQMQELGKQMPMEKMKKADAAAHDSSMQQSMQQSSQQLKSGQKSQAMKSQMQAGKSMQQMSQSLTEMQEQLLANQMAEAMNGLRKAMEDMLVVSQKQEQLKNQSQKLDYNSPQFRENADHQMNLQSDLSSIANSLAELSQQSFVVTPEMGKALGKAMGQMNMAMNGLEQRSSQQASGAQGDAMASLNQGATIVQNAMKQLQQGGGSAGGSLLQQLQRMSAQQQGINAQTQQLGQGGQEQPGGLSQQQLERMGRLAAEQQAVQKSMEQLNREAQTSPEKNKILGDLKKIADEMKEVVQSLEQHSADTQTQQKQDRILSRMLNAQRSLRERDYEEQRKATTGRTVTLKSPSELKKQSEPEGLKRDLQRASESGYSKEYLELIRRYYETIEKGSPR